MKELLHHFIDCKVKSERVKIYVREQGFYMKTSNISDQKLINCLISISKCHMINIVLREQHISSVFNELKKADNKIYMDVSGLVHLARITLATTNLQKC
jgi:hypothetical protein